MGLIRSRALATPLTVCLVVLGRHVENLKFLEVMFGDRPPLSPPQLFYQRMLAEDPAEALDNAEQFLKERPVAAYYDEVVLKGLNSPRPTSTVAHWTRSIFKNADSVIELVKELEGITKISRRRRARKMSKRRLPSIPSRTLVSIIFRFSQKTSLGRTGEEKLRCYALRGPHRP